MNKVAPLTHALGVTKATRVPLCHVLEKAECHHHPPTLTQQPIHRIQLFSRPGASGVVRCVNRAPSPEGKAHQYLGLARAFIIKEVADDGPICVAGQDALP